MTEWRNVARYEDSVDYSFQIQLHENNKIKFLYDLMSGNYSDGSSASIGVENSTGGGGVQYSYNQNLITSFSTISFGTIDNGNSFFLE